MAAESQPTRMEIIRAFVPNSPFAQQLGLRISELEQDRAVLEMPFKAELATMGEMVHGGAIGTLADTAGMCAAWADSEVPEKLAGSTVGMTLDFLAPAMGSDLRAVATVSRRGRRLVRCEITVQDQAGAAVAKSLLTYGFA